MRSFKVRSTLWIAIVATALVYPQASAQGVVATGTQRTPATGSKIAVQAPVTVDFKDVRLYEYSDRAAAHVHLQFYFRACVLLHYRMEEQTNHHYQ